ncbi:MAG TPA: NADH-quinone oxidoreductase subunit C [Polyangiaceae bacterium]|jgi:NADH-quinone oxidoreductase subunit C|nr:NADH-quinone oxidoreductase subunit C [Polyangiaceae bacterium]
MTPTLVIEKLRTEFGDAIGEASEFRGELSLTVKAEKIRAICAWLKSNVPFEMLTDLSGVDHYGEEPRFEVVYVLYSLEHNCYLRLKARVSEESPSIDSIVSVWSGANWHEREAFDMYGIRFAEHPNLERILMWPGYPYFPLRKDFPLAGLPAELPREAEPAAGSAGRAPMAGGPFVAGGPQSVFSSGGKPSTLFREPRQYDSAQEQLIKLRTLPRKETV